MEVDVAVEEGAGDPGMATPEVRSLAMHVLAHEGVIDAAAGPLELLVWFVGEERMAEMNRSHMGRSGPTDVLSFPIDGHPHLGLVPGDAVACRQAPHGAGESLEEAYGVSEVTGRRPGAARGLPVIGNGVPWRVGDVVVCAAVARRQSAATGTSPRDEVAKLIVHGILHLLGMDHEEEDEAQRMEAREEELLRTWQH